MTAAAGSRLWRRHALTIFAQDSFESVHAGKHARRPAGTLERLERVAFQCQQHTAFRGAWKEYFSPKAALAFAVNPDWSLKPHGRAVRMPTVSDCSRAPSPPTARQQRSGSRAGTLLTQELSAIGEFDHADFRCTLFFEDTRDALYSQINAFSGTTITTIQNVDRIRTRGVEMSAHVRSIDTLELSASLTWTHSRILANENNPATVGRWQPRVPEWRATALATWRPIEKLSASLGARYSGLQYNQIDNSRARRELPGFQRFLVFDSRLRYEFGERWAAGIGHRQPGQRTVWLFTLHAPQLQRGGCVRAVRFQSGIYGRAFPAPRAEAQARWARADVEHI